MAMTPDELKKNAEASQKGWGDYGVQETDAYEVVVRKFSVQIETLMRQLGKMGEGFNQLALRCAALEKRIEKLQENAPKIILPGA